MNESSSFSMGSNPIPDTPIPDTPIPEVMSTFTNTDTNKNQTSELLGAVDIVEAFTALRHEIKLQVRGGRELQQSFQESLLRLEQKLTAPPINATPSSESRKMAEAIADIEESLQRAIESIVPKAVVVREENNVLNQCDAVLSKAPWIARAFAGRWIAQLRSTLVDSMEASKPAAAVQDASYKGLELLLARVHRLMKQFEIERVNVLHQAFDAETMNAVDMIHAPSVPSAHVAQQLRPLYLWRNVTLRCAEVRIAT